MKPQKLLLTIAAGLLLSACNLTDRLANVGEAPALSGIDNPTQQAHYRPVSMPMPEMVTGERQANSLWQAGRKSFFKDQRASQVGDIITVLINIEDDASLTNTTERKRTNTDNASIGGLFGLESELGKKLPDAVNPGGLLGLDSDLSNKGEGTIDREEEINLKVAAVITQVLPNGNLVLHGRQEALVNFEVRELQVSGIVRPEDISTENTITSDKIAEARIAYGGRGHISDVQQPRYGSQVLDILMPF